MIKAEGGGRSLYRELPNELPLAVFSLHFTQVVSDANKL
jgi:hypothetical protein